MQKRGGTKISWKYIKAGGACVPPCVRFSRKVVFSGQCLTNRETKYVGLSTVDGSVLPFSLNVVVVLAKFHRTIDFIYITYVRCARSVKIQIIIHTYIHLHNGGVHPRWFSKDQHSSVQNVLNILQFHYLYWLVIFFLHYL